MTYSERFWLRMRATAQDDLGDFPKTVSAAIGILLASGAIAWFGRLPFLTMAQLGGVASFLVQTALGAVTLAFVYGIGLTIFAARKTHASLYADVSFERDAAQHEVHELLSQLNSLMGPRSRNYPTLRERAATLFSNFKLDAAERELLLTRANDVLTGNELDPDIQPSRCYIGE